MVAPVCSPALGRLKQGSEWKTAWVEETQRESILALLFRGHPDTKPKAPGAHCARPTALPILSSKTLLNHCSEALLSMSRSSAVME